MSKHLTDLGKRRARLLRELNETNAAIESEVVRLAPSCSISSLARESQFSRPTIYAILKAHNRSEETECAE